MVSALNEVDVVFFVHQIVNYLEGDTNFALMLLREEMIICNLVKINVLKRLSPLSSKLIYIWQQILSKKFR